MSSPYDSDKPVVGVVMGSDSDWSIMEEAATVLEEFGIPYEADVVSAHRMPEDMIAYGQQAHQRGIRVIIAGAGGAARLGYRIACYWCPGAAEESRRHGFPAFYRADARGGSGGDRVYQRRT